MRHRFLIHVRQVFINMRLAEVRDAARLVEQAFSAEIATIKTRYEAAVEGMSDEDKVDLSLDYQVDEWRVAAVMAQHVRRSLFLSLYSFLEDDLAITGDYLGEKKGLSIRVKDMAGKGIQRSQVFLRKVLEIPYSWDSKEWQLLLGYAEIRNAIAHRGGRLPNTRDPKILLVLKHNSGITIDGDLVSFGPEANDQISETILDFWADLFYALTQAVPETSTSET